MKRISVMVLALALVLSYASLVSAETVITHLVYESHGQPSIDYFTRMAAEFAKTHPGVRVDVVVGKQDKMTTMMAAGVWPDVLDMPDFGYLGKQGEFVDVRPLLIKDNIWKQINAALMQRLIQSNGAVYTVPMAATATAGYFNRSMFNNAALKTPDKMNTKEWTWETMVAYAKKLTRDVNGDGINDEFGIDNAPYYWRAAVFQAGGNWYEWDANEQPVRSLLNTKEVLAGVEHVANICRLGITQYCNATIKQPKDYAFWFGKTAIDNNDGQGIINTYLKDSGVDWDFALQPAGPAGPLTNSAGLGGPMIMARTKNLDLVWEYVKFFALTKQNVLEWVKARGDIPALSSAMIEYPALMGLQSKNFQAVIEQMNYPAPPGYAVDNTMNPRYWNLNDVWNGKIPAATWLQNQHEKLTQYIAELRAKNAAAGIK